MKTNKNKGTVIVSGFPGIGKSYLVNNGYDAMDSDSSHFSWVKGKEGEERHPDFPNNYMTHIKENLGKVKYILVSSHDEVREALKEHNIDYVNVYPDLSLKEEYLKRYKERGSPQGFLNLMEKQYDNFVQGMDDDPSKNKLKLSQGQYLGDVVDQLT